MKDNERVAIAAVTREGLFLRYASNRLRNDERVVTAAVGRDGRALRYASTELRNNVRVVTAAATQNGMSLDYASDELKHNPAVVIAAVAQNSDALRHASDGMKKDPDVFRAALHCTALRENRAVSDFPSLLPPREVPGRMDRRNSSASGGANNGWSESVWSSLRKCDSGLDCAGTMYVHVAKHDAGTSLKNGIEPHRWEKELPSLCSDLGVAPTRETRPGDGRPTKLKE
mmetsp:Transcript_4676/g.13486  ORF Transcript_4676/g.13486 Transcript_4676/m.13486 type:complete len:229 (+) Transcript_4676:1207-1893(+)